MEQELKELLIKDLCSRLPHHLKVKRPDDGSPDYMSAIDIEAGTLMVSYNGYTDGTVFVVCDSKKPMISDAYDNPVDACYEMIMRLNELNLL